MADEQWFTVEEVSALLKVHPQTIRIWLRTGRLRGVLISRRAGWRISESVLNELLGKGEESKIAA